LLLGHRYSGFKAKTAAFQPAACIAFHVVFRTLTCPDGSHLNENY